MDRLSLVLMLATGPTLTGGSIITVLSLGWYGWLSIATAAAIGLALTYPAAYVISRWIKREDPDFDHTRNNGGLVPDPTGPEV